MKALLRRCAPGHGGLDAARLARYDPRREVVICATEMVDSSPALVGVRAVDLDGAEPPEVVVDKRQDGELTELLYGALDGRVSARRQR